MLGFADRWL